MDLSVIENNLEMVDSVVSCKIVTDADEKIEEIHIVSNDSRGAKQIARDIQSVLVATYNIPVDYKKISIAQIADNSLKKAEHRLKLEGVSHDILGQRAVIKVSISNSDNVYENSVSGINTSRNKDRMLVDATLKTIEEACSWHDAFIFEDIRTIPIVNDRIVLVIVMGIIDGVEKRLCGSCIINNSYEVAVVKATLDAVNRVITK
ncbi:hypothetical protein E9840_02465 [Tissierella creatinini]|nr:hypothetical protein E9840_02465 [Tissierella creatinini]TJX64678.1 hypothetical protein E8P77_11395 [Soehngenia saccharolytica]